MSAPLTLVIGNKNYSSWSLRPWLLLRHLGLPFREQQIWLDQPDTQAQIRRLSPAGRVPVLLHGELVIWDSLAISEYVCELTGRGWPAAPSARARARCVCAEMHSGFAALRSKWPMNARASDRQVPPDAPLAADLARIDALWTQCRGTDGAGGPWLFGDYSVADAMFAPVALRCRTYGARLGALAEAYCRHVLADPHLEAWVAAARAEPQVIAAEEVGTA